MITPRVHESGEKVLEVEGVDIDVGGRRLLSDVTFHVVRGEFLCLLGPNGSGKSTLLKCFLGFREPDAGTIAVLGSTPEKARPRLGYLPQLKGFDRSFPATTLELVVAAVRGEWPVRVKPVERDRAMAALVRARAESLADKPLRGLSGGETQRVFLARALVTDPELLLLDEPAAGVDHRGRDELYDLLHEIAHDDHLAAVMVTHSVVAIHRTAEKIAFIDGTLKAFGRPAELLASAELVDQLGGHGPDGVSLQD
jgi:ABC-type Mn2+/Zn2+ transport system ATPase subunit